MSDTSYTVEIKPASKSGYHTPAEARAYYGRYGRDGFTIHGWGGGEPASRHDNIVNYFLAQGELGNKSTNYVCSDIKITLMVGPDDVAWCSQAGNPTTISIEFQPTLGAEGYKKGGWLIDQLEQRYGKTLPLYPHSFWTSTACPVGIDLNRLRQEANNWKNGVYDQSTPPPVVVEPPKTITLTMTDIPNKKVKLVRDANLWNLHFTSYAKAEVVKTLPAGTILEVSATAKHPLGSTYYLSEYSYSKGIGNGINVKDCEDVAPAPPTPAPVDVTPPKQVEIPVKTPEVLTKDQEQDAQISALNALVSKIVAFLGSIFKDFK